MANWNLGTPMPVGGLILWSYEQANKKEQDDAVAGQRCICDIHIRADCSNKVRENCA